MVSVKGLSKRMRVKITSWTGDVESVSFLLPWGLLNSQDLQLHMHHSTPELLNR